MSGEAPAAGPLPRPRDILAEVTAALSQESQRQVPAAAEQRYSVRFRRQSSDAQREYAHLQGLRDHYRHKGRWSNFLMFVMAGMVIFQSVLLGLVGAGIWDFSRYAWLLPALLVQNLAQVIGLAVFVVKALFRDVGELPKGEEE
jgi:ABC-type transport system involved in cytochrome bd biosynthesis fused ATPase/permease subunit